MAFDISALAAYTKENEKSLVTKSLFDAKTQSIISSKGTVMADIKSAEQINVLDTDAVFQAGGTCGFASSGTTSFTRRSLTIGKYKVNESLCPKTLETKYLQLELTAGSRPEKIPFEQQYTGLKTGVIAQQLETNLWQGDTASGDANLARQDGLIKIIDAAGTVVAPNGKKMTGTITTTGASTAVVGVGTLFTTESVVGDKLVAGGVVQGTITVITNNTNIVLAANTASATAGVAFTNVPAGAANFSAPILSATGITEANVRAIVKSVWKSIPQKVKGKDDVIIFCGWEVFESYIGALIEANLFAYTAGNEAQKAGEIKIPGTQYMLTAVHGLDSTNRLYAMRASNMYMGCDILGEEDKWEIFYAKEADEVRFVAEWKLGVQVAFPNEIVSFLLA